MIDHPLFNFEDPDDTEKRKRNIAYINIMACEPGKKKITLTNQWEPEELQTPADVLEAVGGVYGTYELIGRGTKHQIMDRQMISLGAPKGHVPPPPPAPAQPPPPPVVTMAQAPTMQASGIIIPSTMDPNVAMVISMMAMQNQNAQFNAQNQTAMITGLATAFAPVIGAALSRPGVAGAPGSQQAAESGFLKGIEVMAALKEGVDSANKGPATDWGTVSGQIAQAVKGLVEVARTTAGTPAPAAPVVPPGGPG
jgi:hypothetical protein